MSKVWTPEMVEIRLIEAAATLRRLPAPEYRKLGRFKVAWPDVPPPKAGTQDWWAAYGSGTAKAGWVKASIGEITRLDQTHDWVLRFLDPGTLKVARLPPDTMLVLWYRAMHLPWSKVVGVRARRWNVVHSKRGGKSPVPGGNSHVSLRSIHKAALELLARRLNEEGIPCDVLED